MCLVEGELLAVDHARTRIHPAHVDKQCLVPGRQLLIGRCHGLEIGQQFCDIGGQHIAGAQIAPRVLGPFRRPEVGIDVIGIVFVEFERQPDVALRRAVKGLAHAVRWNTAAAGRCQQALGCSNSC